MLPTTRFCHYWLLVHSSMSPDFSSLSAKTYFISRGLSLLFKSSQLDSERSSSGTLTSAAPTSILRFFLFCFILFCSFFVCSLLSHPALHSATWSFICSVSSADPSWCLRGHAVRPSHPLGHAGWASPGGNSEIVTHFCHQLTVLEGGDLDGPHPIG